MSNARRVIVDTSTMIGALLRPASAPRRALMLAIESCELCASEGTFGEFERVIGRRKFDAYLPAAERLEFVQLIRRASRMVAVSEENQEEAAGVCRDPSDDQFLALGLECAAHAIVSSDADLLDLHTWRGIDILPPTAFIDWATQVT